MLRIYRVNERNQDPEDDQQNGDAEPSNIPSDAPKPRPVDLLREEESFSSKPIQQLAIIKEANILVSLSDAFVSFHDLQGFSLSERPEQTKGARAFAVTSNIVKDDETNLASIVSRLAVAVKRKVLVWSWQDMELSRDPLEFTLAAPVKCLAWTTGQKIVAGMDPGYSLIDTDDGQISDVNRKVTAVEAAGPSGSRFGAVNSSGMSYMGMGGWVPRPMATKIGAKEMLLAKDVNTLFIDTDGNAIDRRQVPWHQAPDAVGYSYPYLLSLNSSKGTLDIRNPETLSLLQRIPLANAGILHVPQPNISLAHAGKGFHVASERCIWRMEANGYDMQLQALVERQLFDEAISILNMLEDTLLEDKYDRISDIKTQKALRLFNEQKYQAAMDLFSEASTPPETVIALYPELIAGELSKVHEPEPKAENEMGVVSTLKKGLLGQTQSPQKLKPSTSVQHVDTTSVLSSTEDGSETDASHRPPSKSRKLGKVF